MFLLSGSRSLCLILWSHHTNVLDLCLTLTSFTFCFSGISTTLKNLSTSVSKSKTSLIHIWLLKIGISILRWYFPYSFSYDLRPLSNVESRSPWQSNWPCWYWSNPLGAGLPWQHWYWNLVSGFLRSLSGDGSQGSEFEDEDDGSRRDLPLEDSFFPTPITTFFTVWERFSTTVVRTIKDCWRSSGSFLWQCPTLYGLKMMLCHYSGDRWSLFQCKDRGLSLIPP